MGSYHTHSEQKHIERKEAGRTGEVTITAYCITCGEKTSETKLKGTNFFESWVEEPKTE